MPPQTRSSYVRATPWAASRRTPVEVEEGGRVALHDAHALPTRHIPQPQGAIFTATEQAATVGCEGQAGHGGGMSLQRRPNAALFDLSEQDRFVMAATGQCEAIWTPGHAIHLIRMPQQRLETA